MPTHVYQPTRNPPSWVDRLLVHPMDSTVAVLALLYGLLGIGSLLCPGFTPSNSIDLLPTLVTGAVSAFWTVGGALALVGIFWSGDNVSTGWELERLGWILTAGGLLVYGVSTLWHYSESIYSWMTPTILGLGAILRFVSVYLIERHTRRVIAEVKGHPLVS